MISESVPLAALRDAVASAGSQAAFARIIGKSQQAVSQMLAEKRVLPAEHVLTVERETGISRHALRPDIYPRDESSASPEDPMQGLVA